MLTTMFYYNHYTPYIISNNGPKASVFPKKPMITEKSTPEQRKSQIFFLNKSLKNEIVKYARNLSSSVSGIKESSRQLVSDMEQFNKNVDEEGLDRARKWLSDDIKAFSEAVSNADDFTEKQSQSRVLKDYMERIKYSLASNKNEMAELGVKVSGKAVSFAADQVSKMDSRQINVAIGRSIRIFDEIYEYSTGLLTSPMVEHMSFKEFQYHYNYKMGSVVTDGFNMVESGMVVDMVI